MVSKWENTCAADVRSSVALRFWVFGCFRELKFPVARYGPVERGVLLRLSASRRNGQIPRLLPGRPERSPAQAPLGTVLESFPSSRLEPLTKTNLGRGDPAISCGCESLERLAYLCPAEKVRGYQEDKCAQRNIAVSQSTQYLRGRRGWRRPGP